MNTNRMTTQKKIRIAVVVINVLLALLLSSIVTCMILIHTGILQHTPFMKVLIPGMILIKTGLLILSDKVEKKLNRSEEGAK